MKAQFTRCPHCGQSLKSVRFGVIMRPVWVRIVDTIQRAGPDGISRADLIGAVYGDASVSRALMSVNVNHINTALLATDYRIKGGQQGYRIVRVVREAA